MMKAGRMQFGMLVTPVPRQLFICSDISFVYAERIVWCLAAEMRLSW